MSEDVENLIAHIELFRSPLRSPTSEVGSFGDFYEEYKLLTPKNVSFCYEYLKDHNRTKAYMRAYGCSYRTANINANRLWKNHYIHELIGSINLQLKLRIFEISEIQRAADIMGLTSWEKQIVIDRTRDVKKRNLEFF